MGLESDRALLNSLTVISQLAGADAVALFAVRADRIRLRQCQGIREHDLEIAHATFQGRRADLDAGRSIEVGTRSLLPLLVDDRLEGLVYFDAPMPHSLPRGSMRRVLEQVQNWLLDGSDLEAGGEPAAPQLARYDPDEAMRQQLITAALRYGGNVSAMATALGVTRQTIYDRADRLGVDLARYRVRLRRRPV